MAPRNQYRSKRRSLDELVRTWRRISASREALDFRRRHRSVHVKSKEGDK